MFRSRYKTAKNTPQKPPIPDVKTHKNLRMPDLIKVQFNEVLTQIQHVYQQLNSTLIEIYWNVGKYISEQVKKMQTGEKAWLLN